jgi:glycosyltransferase involved in cell wall biosynthesis
VSEEPTSAAQQLAHDEPPSRPIVLFVVNVAWFFCLHRLHLARAAQAAGYEVHVATAPDTPQAVREIQQAGLHYHPLGLRRGSWGVLQESRLVGELYRLYRALRPNLVHHVTIKPVLCGTLAARIARVPAIVNAMSGLGFVFVASGWRAALRRRTVMMAYRLLFARSGLNVIFENRDDFALFVESRLIKPEQGRLIYGAGVDLRRYRPNPKPGDVVPLVVLPGRMLRIKGVAEFCAAAALVRASGVQARFALVGGVDAGNPTGVSRSWLLEQQQSGAVEWWGHREDMVSVYGAAHIVCLPSYGEGLPTVLTEAAACGCAVVATDVPGCRDVITDRVTGLLVPPRDPPALAQALIRLISDAGLRAQLSGAALRKVAAEFNVEVVQSGTLALYRELLTNPPVGRGLKAL